MQLVVIESPLGSREDGSRLDLNTVEGRAEFQRNQLYALRCMRHSLSLGEAPFASHVLYPLVLSDADDAERRQGMLAGFAWAEAVALAPQPTPKASGVPYRRSHRVVYVDYGVTPGMRDGIERARALGQSIRYRRIGKNEDLMTSFEADNPPASGQTAFAFHPSEV